MPDPTHRVAGGFPLRPLLAPALLVALLGLPTATACGAMTHYVEVESTMVYVWTSNCPWHVTPQGEGWYYVVDDDFYVVALRNDPHASPYVRVTLYDETYTLP